jgi:hypothetical protein
MAFARSKNSNNGTANIGFEADLDDDQAVIFSKGVSFEKYSVLEGHARSTHYVSFK